MAGHARHDSGLPALELSFFDIRSDEVVIQSKSGIGEGSFGAVCLGTYYGSTVAVKRVKIDLKKDPDVFKYLRREVELLKSIRHPNIVQFLGFMQTKDELTLEDKVCFLTEFVTGGDLANWLSKEPVHLIDPAWNVRLKLAGDVAAAMSYMHSKKIVFRDLKGSNILLDNRHMPQLAKVCDFGLARILDRSAKKKRSSDLTICGTNEWMAPEVIMGAVYDNKSDVFSYGIVLLELIIGTKQVLSKVKRTPKTRFGIDVPEVSMILAQAGCPSDLGRLVLECCQYEPASRPDFNAIIAVLKGINSFSSFATAPLVAAPAAPVVKVFQLEKVAPNGADLFDDDEEMYDSPTVRRKKNDVRTAAKKK